MINLALIGNGKWGKNYLKEILKIPDVQIKYIETYNYKNLLDKKDIDGLIIATPDSTHFEIINTFPNLFLLVEKPVVMSESDALLLTNPKIMAGHIYLYNLALLEVLKAAGDILEIDFIIKNTETAKNTTKLWHLASHGVALAVFLKGRPAAISAKENNKNLFIELIYNKKNKSPFTFRIDVGWNYSKKRRIIKIKGDKNYTFDVSKKQKVAPLENECREFIKFINGGIVPSNIKHIKEVTSVLQEIQLLIN